MEELKKARRGFALMDPVKQREIAGKGGRTAHEKGTAFEFQKGSDKAREAGRAGGFATQRRRKEMRGAHREPNIVDQMIQDARKDIADGVVDPESVSLVRT